MKDGLDGDSNVNLLFEVDCIIYLKDEIINNCKIIKKESNGIIHASSKYTGMQLTVPPNMNIFNEGDYIPVIVKRVRYNIGQRLISVLAMPFVPVIYEPIYYKIDGVLTKTQNTDIQILIGQIKDYADYFNTLNSNSKKIYKFFNELLQQKNISKKNYNKIDICNIIDIKSGYIYKQYNYYDDNYITVDESLDNDTNVINENIFIIFSSILILHLSHLHTLKEFLQQYSTFDEVQNHKNIWKFYTMLKK